MHSPLTGGAGTLEASPYPLGPTCSEGRREVGCTCWLNTGLLRTSEPGAHALGLQGEGPSAPTSPQASVLGPHL